MALESKAPARVHEDIVEHAYRNAERHSIGSVVFFPVVKYVPYLVPKAPNVRQHHKIYSSSSGFRLDPPSSSRLKTYVPNKYFATTIMREETD